MTRSSLASLILVLALSGCGQVDIPQESPEPETVMVPAPPAEGTLPESDPDDAQPDDSLTNVSATLSEMEAQCASEKETLTQALEVNTQALEMCESEKRRLQAQGAVSSPVVTPAQSDRYERFVSYYLENKQLAEFPFPKCGARANFASEPWFGGFTTALESAQIPFGNSIVQASNLSGGCFSPDGNMAFFLGAQSDAFSQFHLLKYDIGAGVLEEAFLVGGDCGVVCPSELGQRQGSHLTLYGQGGGERVEYWYYYADNILERK